MDKSRIRAVNQHRMYILGTVFDKGVCMSVINFQNKLPFTSFLSAATQVVKKRTYSEGNVVSYFSGRSIKGIFLCA